MPSTSKKQHNFMAAVANNPAFAKKVGVPQSVGKDFSNADKGKTFKRGDDMAKAKKMAFGGMSHGTSQVPPQRRHGGKPAPSTLSSLEKFKSMIEKPSGGAPTGTGGPMRPPRDIGTGGGPRGGRPAGLPPRDPGTGAGPNRPRSFGSTINSAPRTPPSASLNKPAGMGMNKGGMAASSMGKVKTAAPSKDGVAAKGKTKGKMVTMKSGGKMC